MKITDIDGKVSYSSIISLFSENRGFAVISIVPSPIDRGGRATLSITSAVTANIQLVIYDINGRELHSQNEKVLQGINRVPLRLERLAAGSYQLTVHMSGEASKTIRFVKE